MFELSIFYLYLYYILRKLMSMWLCGCGGKGGLENGCVSIKVIYTCISYCIFVLLCHYSESCLYGIEI